MQVLPVLKLWNRLYKKRRKIAFLSWNQKIEFNSYREINVALVLLKLYNYYMMRRFLLSTSSRAVMELIFTK